MTVPPTVGGTARTPPGARPVRTGRDGDAPRCTKGRHRHDQRPPPPIVGNLTRDPEIRYTREGQATATLGVAANRRWQNRETNEWEESTSFFDVVAWRDLAENVALSLTKGMRVIVTGRLEQRSWETEDGDRRFKVEIVADEVGPSLRFATVDVHRTSSAPARRRPGQGPVRLQDSRPA